MKPFAYILWVVALVGLSSPFWYGDVRAAFRLTTLPTLIMLNAWFAYQLVVTARKHWPSITSFLRCYRWSLLALTLLCASLFGKMDHQFRVLADEANLMATAMNLYHHQSPEATIEGEFHHGQYYSTYNAMPKRPLQFSTLVYYLHNLFGYDFDNAFYLNQFLLVVFLMTVFCLGLRWGGPLVAWIAVFVMLSHPITLLLAFAAGFELFSMLMLLLLFCAIHFAQDKERVITLWIGLFAIILYARYEYALLATVVMVFGIALNPGVFWQYCRKHHVALLFFSLIIFPRLYQHDLTSGRHNEEKDKILWSFTYMAAHFKEFLLAMFWEHRSPFNRTVNAVIVLAIGTGIVKFLRSGAKLKRAGQLHLATGILLFGTMLVVYLGHSYGKALHQISYRYFLGPVVLFGLAGVYALAKLPLRWRQGALIACIAGFITHSHIAIEDPIGATAVLARSTHYLSKRLDESLDPDRSSLLIIERPLLYVVQERSAVAFLFLKRHPGKLQRWLHSGRHRKLITVQEINKSTGRPVRANHLPKHFFPLRVVEEIPYRPGTVLRISEYNAFPEVSTLPTVAH